jgi:hypothetical protein
LLVHYRGLKKHAAQLVMLCALSNLRTLCIKADANAGMSATENSESVLQGAGKAPVKAKNDEIGGNHA